MDERLALVLQLSMAAFCQVFWLPMAAWADCAVDTPPVVVRQDQPLYPYRAPDGVGWYRCLATVTVDPSGAVTEVTSEDCAKPYATAIDVALSRWTWQAATCDGVAVAAKTKVVVVFVKNRRARTAEPTPEDRCSARVRTAEPQPLPPGAPRARCELAARVDAAGSSSR